MGGKTANEESVKVAEAQKGAHVTYFRGCGPVLDTCDFYRVHASYPLFKDFPQVIHSQLVEHALLELEVEVVLHSDCEDRGDGVDVVLERSRFARSNADVVHIYPDN